MNRFSRRARRFFWWCAAADASILEAPDTPRLDGIKYAAIGALVCLTTTVAAGGWAHNAAIMMADRPFSLPLAAGLGLLMGAVVFCTERVLVVSIRQDAGMGAKLGAFAWRSVIASLAAALMTIPFALAYFNNGILARLDDEKLALMAEKRDAVDRVLGLKDKAAAIAAADRDLALNQEQRDRLPADIEALSAAAVYCESERAELDRSLQPKIAATSRLYASVRREIERYDNAPRSLTLRLAALGKQIVDWKKALAAKTQACEEAAGRFATARAEYYQKLDREWRYKVMRKQAAQQKLDRAQDEAGTLLDQANAAVAQVTTPDLSARLRALGQMVGRDLIVAVVLAIAYAFFFLIDIMPLLAKLVMLTTYDRRVSSDYRRAAAKIERDTEITETDMAISAAIAQAERLGLEMLLKQNGSEAVGKLAELRLRMEAEKAEVTASFGFVSVLIDEFHCTQARLDDITDRYAGKPDLLHHIEAVREALARAMQRAASVKTEATGTASA